MVHNHMVINLFYYPDWVGRIDMIESKGVVVGVALQPTKYNNEQKTKP